MFRFFACYDADGSHLSALETQAKDEAARMAKAQTDASGQRIIESNEVAGDYFDQLCRSTHAAAKLSMKDIKIFCM